MNIKTKIREWLGIKEVSEQLGDLKERVLDVETDLYNTDGDLELKFIALSEDAIAPNKAHDDDSGYDLFAAEDVVIKPYQRVRVATDVAVAIPKGHEAQVRPRSGISGNTFATVHFGTVDRGYTGNVAVTVENTCYRTYKGDNIVTGIGVDVQKLMANNELDLTRAYDIHIKKGDKIAQLVVAPIAPVKQEHIVLTGFKTNTHATSSKPRLDKGFGSTGVQYSGDVKSTNQHDTLAYVTNTAAIVTADVEPPKKDLTVSKGYFEITEPVEVDTIGDSSSNSNMSSSSSDYSSSDSSSLD